MARIVAGQARRTRRRVLIVALTDVGRDPRVDRQIEFLRGEFDLVVAALAPPRRAGVEFVPIPIPPRPPPWLRLPRKALRGGLLLSRRFEALHRSLFSHLARALGEVEADALLANDIDTLPAALEAARGVPVVYDAHEYAPEELDERPLLAPLLRAYRLDLCRRHMPRAAATMTVCEGIAAEYERVTGVRPAVVTNAPPFADLHPFRRDAADDRIRLVHHGLATAARGLEVMLEVMALLDERFTLDLFLVEHPPEREYMERLRARAAALPRVRVLAPVPMRDLPRCLNEYDVGLSVILPTTVSLKLSLPNKLFEFIQARLAVAIGPSVEMRRVVEAHGCGVVAGDFRAETMAALLRSLDRATVDRLKARSHEAATVLCAERNRERVVALVRGALDGDTGAS